MRQELLSRAAVTTGRSAAAAAGGGWRRGLRARVWGPRVAPGRERRESVSPKYPISYALESPESRKMDSVCLRFFRIFWNSIIAPWKFLFAFVPTYHIAHGWITFICFLIFTSCIAYGVTKLTDQISCVTGVSPYVIAFTAVAAGTSCPDLVASKIAAKRQVSADSAIANITCSNSVNIYVGIGVPWLINTVYNFFVYQEPLYIDNAPGLSFSLLVFFATSFGCIIVWFSVALYLVLSLGVLGCGLGQHRCTS